MLKLVISIMLHALRTCVLLPNRTLLYLPGYNVVVTVLYMYPDGDLQLKTKHSHVTVHFTLVEGFVSDCPAILFVSKVNKMCNIYVMSCSLVEIFESSGANHCLLLLFRRKQCLHLHCVKYFGSYCLHMQ
jgi:hypothetical protein